MVAKASASPSIRIAPGIIDPETSIDTAKVEAAIENIDAAETAV